MGKGNRSRIERAMNESAIVGKNVQAKKTTKVSGAGIFVTVAAVLVVVALLIGAIGVLNDGGWFARTKTVVKEGNFKVDGTMMNYFYTTQFNNYYQTYYQMYSQLASSGLDVSSYVYKAMGISDPNKSLKEQDMPTAEGAEKITVFDFYMNLAEDYVTRMLTYCKFAAEQGIALTEEDYADIDHTIEELKTSYKSQKALYEQFGMAYYSSFSAFLADNYGTGVKERDVRNCLELITLAAKFEEKLTDEKKQEIIGDKTNAAVEEFVKNNPASFLMADYYSYSFSVSNKGKTDAEFEAEKADLLEKAKKLAECTDKETYKASVLALLEEAKLKEYRDKNWNTFLKENGNDEDKTEEAIKKSFYEKQWTDALKDVAFDATLTEGFKHPTDPTKLSKWIFGFDAGEHNSDCKHEGEHEKSNDPAKKGDLTYIEDETEKEETVKKEEATTGAATTGTTAEETTTDAAAPAAETTKEETTTKAPSTSTSNKVTVTTYTVTVYLLEKETYRNTEITKHFGYVMFASKADAEKFYAEFQKGEMNKDSLVELVEKMHEEVKPYAYDGVEDYLPGDLEDQQLTGADKWLETAKPGDCSGVIEVVHSKPASGTTKELKTTYYAVLVYDQDGDEAWYCDALEGATGEAVSDWFEENGLELTFNEKAYKYINV